jgi:hypothetical protein
MCPIPSGCFGKLSSELVTAQARSEIPHFPDSLSVIRSRQGNMEAAPPGRQGLRGAHVHTMQCCSSPCRVQSTEYGGCSAWSVKPVSPAGSDQIPIPIQSNPFSRILILTLMLSHPSSPTTTRQSLTVAGVDDIVLAQVESLQRY